MADILDEKQSEVIRITGGGEDFVADVIQEDGNNKLLVKSTVVPEILGNRFVRYAEDGGSNDMNVNGGGTPVEFFINADATGDLVVSSLVFEAFDSGIRMDRFLGRSSSLSTGVIIEVKSQNTTFQFLPIKNTLEFDSLFSYGNGRSYQVVFASANDTMVSRFGPSTPFLIKQAGTYATDDYIKIIISDSLQQVNSFRFLAEGSIDV